MLFLVDSPGNVVHLIVEETELIVRPLADPRARHGCVECDGQFLIVELCTETKISGRLRQEFRFEPLLMLIDRVARDGKSLLEPIASIGRHCGQVRFDQVVENAQDAAVLRHRGLGMNAGDARWLERGADLPVEPGELFETFRHASKSDRKGRELARHEAVDRRSAERRIGERIPGPLLQCLQIPEVGAKVVRQDRMIDLVLAGKLSSIDPAELFEITADKACFLDAALGADLIEPAVEAVVAEKRCRHWRQ